MGIGTTDPQTKLDIYSHSSTAYSPTTMSMQPRAELDALSLNNRDLPPALTLPIRFLHGDKDRSVPTASIQDAVAALPNASALPFSNVGHSPFEEVPELFNAALLEFARTVRGPVAD